VSSGDIEELMSRDYRSDLDDVFSGSPEAIYLLAFDEFLAITATIANFGYLDGYDAGAPLIYVSDSVFDANTLNNVPPEVLSRLRGTSQIPPEESENFVALSELMLSEGLGQPEIYDSARHDAAVVIALAIQQAGSLDVDAVKDALSHVSRAETGDVEVDFRAWAEAREVLLSGGGVNYEGAAGAVDFSPQGDATSGTYAVWSVANPEGEVEFEIIKTLTYDAAP
jgi:ABC-type branched-subunit amino acid transport system substrate-binding protein